uniref:Fatty acid hydroxylase domain-containing protein n=1 Tax=Meloidogyne javanica TaxID=6303 RepID=A0A915MSP6_MELJA
MLTLAMPRKGEETTPGIIAPPLQNQRGNGWFPKQGPQQIVGPPPRGPPPPVIDNWPRPPDVYWNNYPPSVQHSQLPPQQIKKPPVFGAYGVRSNEDYMPPIRGGSVPADYVLPPRGERGYVYSNQIQRPHPSTCDQSAFPQIAGGGAGFTRKPRSPSFDPREEMLRSMPFGSQQKLGRSDNYDSWVGGESNSSGGPPLMNPNDAEAILNKLPNDAVSTALRMLQSIMTAQQQKEHFMTEEMKKKEINKSCYLICGEKVLQIAAGSDIGQFLRGEEELLGFIHKHSLGAYNILKRYSLDKQFKNDPLIDGQEPILFKIGELGERYWTWIHQPYDGAVRMFKSNFLEQLTRTKWWHGLHHKTPLDKDRLVFPPAAALIIVGFFYSFYRLLLPYPIFCCFGTGKLTGYIIYDLIHYYLHHGTPEANSKWHKRKIYHHNHHFKDSQSGFGISTTLWDHVFGTLGAVR